MTLLPHVALRKPSPERIAPFLSGQGGGPFTYEGVGCTRAGAPPPGFTVDRYRAKLGAGRACYARAVAALRRWEQFNLGWVRADPSEVAIKAGVHAAVLAKVLGVWFLNAARVVYVIDEERRFGFAYGTLAAHVERGEERFLVEWLPDDTVWYDVLAFSRPGHWMTWLGYPLVRWLQKRFGRDSQAVMAKAVAL